MQETFRPLVRQALHEDIHSGDITSNLLDNGLIFNAKILAKEAGILCGSAWVQETYAQLNSAVRCVFNLKESEPFVPNQVIATITGPAKDLLTGERTALNGLQMLSGIATTTALYVSALENSSTRLLDTRKTIPLWRQAQKYAVRCGGGVNHRMGLFDAYLIKENHIKAYGSITQVIERARLMNPHKTLEIEVQNLDMLQEAIQAEPDIILLDNFDYEMLKKAVHLNRGRIKLEVSGNVRLDQLSTLALLGIDYISVGAITKNIKAIDFSLLIQ
jgi:nicotinate-nucleotide pyrophosphorylase (carboxylating)